MANSDMDQRLRDLGIYSDYYYRLELKPLSQLLSFDEKLLCVLTGVYEETRQLMAITDYRVIIISAGAVRKGEARIIKRKAVASWNFDKKFLLSSATICTADQTIVFKQTQAKRKELFEKALNSPIKQFDEE